MFGNLMILRPFRYFNFLEKKRMSHPLSSFCILFVQNHPNSSNFVKTQTNSAQLGSPWLNPAQLCSTWLNFFVPIFLHLVIRPVIFPIIYPVICQLICLLIHLVLWCFPIWLLAWPFTILQNDNIMISRDFLRLTAPAAMPGHLGAVSLKKNLMIS